MNEGWNIEYSDSIATLTIHRPKFMNALNTDLLLELDTILTEVEKRGDIRALIITGSGERAFIAGADIDQMTTMGPREARFLIEIGHKVFSRLEQLAIPVIASINGFVLGGGLELALCADLRICSENARFGLPEIKLGVIAGWGGPCRLARVIGESRAKDMFFRGKWIVAKDALNYGMVTEVFENVDELRKGTLRLAEELSEKAPITMRLDKKIINDSLLHGKGIDPLRDALSLAYLFTTEDTKEGVRAFIEKRPPNFKGR